MKETGKVIVQQTPKSEKSVGKMETGSQLKSDAKARFVTGSWSTPVETATTTQPSKPTFSLREAGAAEPARSRN